MKPRWIWIMLVVLLGSLLAGCERKPADPLPGLGAGFRFSTYGVEQNPGEAYWASVGEKMASRFPGSRPQAIWIVGNTYGEGTYLNFPCETDSPFIRCGFVDMNEAALALFDERGVDVWLQVEPGNADLETLIALVLGQYGHHPCVIGFGLDVEWYQSTEGPLGVPITDEEAERWVAAVREHNPGYYLFLKHWEIEWMPPTARDGIMFVNDSQGFENLDALVANFSAWGKHFEGYPVGYQFGYHSDRAWWKDLADPPGEIGQAILEKIPNTRALFWVDFTTLLVFPP